MTRSDSDEKGQRGHGWWKWLTRAGLVLGVVSSVTGIAGFVMAFFYPGKFDQIVEAIRGSNEEVVMAVREVEAAAAGSKRETSEDPRKELVNLGYTFDDSSFWRSVRTGDLAATRLFCEVPGGQFVRLKQDFFDPGSTARQVSTEMLETVTTCRLLDLTRSCRITLIGMNAFFDGTFDDALYSSICGRDALSSLQQEAQEMVRRDEAALQELCRDLGKGDPTASIRFDNDMGRNAPWRIEKFGQARFSLPSLCDAM